MKPAVHRGRELVPLRKYLNGMGIVAVAMWINFRFLNTNSDIVWLMLDARKRLVLFKSTYIIGLIIRNQLPELFIKYADTLFKKALRDD
jgi:hypothetical protein